MAYSRSVANRSVVGRVGLLVVGCTAVLTLSFFGLVAFLTGNTPGVADRIPFYVLGTALAFVASVVGLDGRARNGRIVLITASAAAAATLVLLTMGGEGLAYAVRVPEEALAAQRLLYLLAAGLIATGLGYWGVRHWREVAGTLR